MANAIGLNMKMTASIGQFQKSMSSVDQKLAQIEKSSKATASGMRLLAAIEVGKLAAKGLGSLVGVFKSAASSAHGFFEANRGLIDSLGKMADSTGFSVQSLQVLGRISEEQGISTDALAGGFARMNKRLAEAGQGFGSALKPLQSMGFNIQKLLTLKPEQQFMAITKAISKLPTEGQKSAAAFQIFSDAGIKLFPMFDGLEEKIKATGAEMDDLGSILSTAQVDGVEAMNDAMARTYLTAQKLGQQVLATFAPMIEKANTALLQFVKNFKFDGDIGGVAIAKFLVEGFKRGVMLLAKWADSFYVGLKTFVKAASSILLPIASSLNDFINRNDFDSHEATRRAIDSADRFARSLDKSDLGFAKFIGKTLEALPPIERQSKAISGLASGAEAYEAVIAKKSKATLAAEAKLNTFGNAVKATKEKAKAAGDTLGTHLAEKARLAGRTITYASDSIKAFSHKTETASQKLAAFAISMQKRAAAGGNPGQDPILRGIGQKLQADAALEAWQNVANKIMSQYESMGLTDYARAQLGERMNAERANYVKFVAHKQGLEQKAYQVRAAREQRQLARAAASQKARDERLGKGVTSFLTGFRDRFKDITNTGGNNTTPGGSQGGKTQSAEQLELQKQTPLLQQIRDAIKSGNEMVITSIA